MNFGVDATDSGQYTVVTVRGEIDVYTAPELRSTIEARMREGRRQLVVDLQKVDFLDSSALGVLVGEFNDLRADGGNLSLVCTNPHILKVFQVTQLDEVFSIYDSVEAATA